MEEKVLIGLFAAIFVFSVTMAFVEISAPTSMITGYATGGSTTSNVTISKYFSIAFSTNLSQGIQFGTVSALPATNVNATHNNDSATGNTTMFINVSTDSNTNVDFCIKANDHLTDPSSSEQILIGNETYSNATSTDNGDPVVGDEMAITTSYAKAGYNVTVGGANYYKFWLDIPAGTPSGSFNNSIEFKAVEVSGSC